MKRVILCGLLLCLLGAGGKGYGQEEVDIRTDKRYGSLVAAWNFDGSTREFISGGDLEANNGQASYTVDRNLSEGKSLLIKKGQIFKGLFDSLPTGDGARTVMFWLRKTGCGDADIALLEFGDRSKPRGVMNIRLRPCAEWGDYMTTSFVPDLEGNHKYSDALEEDFYGGFWSHIAITYSKGIVRAYCNGSEVKNYPPSSKTKAQRADTASAEVALGWVMSSDGNDDTMICLDEVRVFSSLLNSRRIKLIYENEFSQIGEVDTGGDGLIDSHEVFSLGTNPNLSDTDNDGLSDFFEVQDGVFDVIEGKYSWHEAVADAKKNGGHLATITSKVENLLIFDFLTKKYLKIPCLWLGATDEKEEGRWTWVTGEPWNYNNWIKSGLEPNNYNQREHYLQIYGAVSYDTYYINFPHHTTDIRINFPGSTYVYGTHFGWNDIAVNGGVDADTPLGYLIEYPKSDPLDPDSDDDGYTDGEEHEAGTNPIDPIDFPQLKSTIQITITDKTASPFGISFKTNEGSTYEFQASGGLKKWLKLQEVKGTGEEVKATDLREAIFQKQYYRIKVLD